MRLRAGLCTAYAAVILVAVAACGWEAEAQGQVRKGCRELGDAPFGTARWYRSADRAAEAFHHAADLDDRWNTVAIAHDRLQRLPADTPPQEFGAELETWVGAVGAECEKVNISL